jgi:hypothetical protein
VSQGQSDPNVWHQAGLRLGIVLENGFKYGRVFKGWEILKNGII